MRPETWEGKAEGTKPGDPSPRPGPHPHGPTERLSGPDYDIRLVLLCNGWTPKVWSAQRNALNCTCAWPFPPPPQVYPGPQAGARLLGEFSGGGVRGEPQWMPDLSRLVRTRTRPTLLSSQRPPGSPAPPAAPHAQRPVSLQV